MSELWLKQPKQDFTQIFRNRGLCFIILLKLGANLSHHFLALSSSPKRSKQEPEWPLGDRTVLTSTATGAQREVGELPWAMHALPLPPAAGSLAGVRWAVFPLYCKAERVA